MITSKFSVYCNFDYYRNLFWCFCISIYEKEKGSLLVSIVVYIGIMSVLYLIQTDWQFFCIYAGSCGCISCDVCTGEAEKHLSENISCSDIFLSVGLQLQWRTDWMILSQKLWFQNRLQEKQLRWTLCWNENSGYCALYRFPCSCNRSDQ